MAQQPRAPGEGDNFVRHIVADPKNVPDVMLLYGYSGASSEEGHERLYLSPDLSSYVEVPNGAILHRAEAAREQDPHGGVTLWVRKDAALKYKLAPAQQAAQQAMAHYFAGALQAGAAAAQPQLPPQTLPQAVCPVTLPDACQVTANIHCPTRQVTCAVTCHATCAAHATCGVTCAATCAVHATCGVTCIATCVHTCLQSCAATCAATCQATCAVTCAATCAPGCTGHVTCAQVCTHITPCRATVNLPECVFPTEICTHVAAQCTNVPNCVLPQAAQAGAAQAGIGAAAQAACALGTIAASVQIACSIACPTRFVTCTPECWVTRYVTCNCTPQCVITRYGTCNFECLISRNPGLCPIASGVACPPPQSIACGSIGCGPGGGPVEQAQICAVGSVVRPPQVSVVCTIEGCATWHASCWWGCPL